MRFALPRRARDPFLLLAIGFAFVFSIHGANWGRVECWNPDQMALRRLHGLRPVSGYGKPPFHTYLTHVLVVWPANRLRGVIKLATHHAPNVERLKFLGARALTILLFAGSVILVYAIAFPAFRRQAAAALALLFGTSAGFAAYAHFLTCDMPLLFWMLLSAFFASRILVLPTMANYLLAGATAGLATATKYNGLAIAAGVIIAHVLLEERPNLLSRKLFAGIAAIPLGFVAGCAGALLEPRKFLTDFAYGYLVTPRYGGETGLGYGAFFARIPEIVGWPGTLVLLVLIVISAALVFTSGSKSLQTKTFLLVAMIALIYIVKIGSFPRIETRFVLPIVPFLILLTAPALARTSFAVPLLLPILLYNSACAWSIGNRFAGDARLAAQEWVAHNISAPARIESSFFSPHWAKLSVLNATELQAAKPTLPGTQLKPVVDIRMPHLHERGRLFAEIFRENEFVREQAARQEGDAEPALFTESARRERNPTYIAVHSFDADGGAQVQRGYYQQLLSGNGGYVRLFDQDSTSIAPWWSYPREIEVVGGRMTILRAAQ